MEQMWGLLAGENGRSEKENGKLAPLGKLGLELLGSQ